MRSEQLEIELLGEQIAMHAAHLDAATHRLLTDLREFDQVGGWYRAGAMSCAHWLSWRVGWDGRTAREHVRVANRLGELPLIDDALRRGEMSYSKVRAMTRVATPANEARLLEQARYATGAQLEKICRLYASVERHDADTTPSDDRQRRHVTRRELDDGMVRITATLHPEEAALVWAALERVAKERCRASGSAGPAPSADLVTGSQREAVTSQTTATASVGLQTKPDLAGREAESQLQDRLTPDPGHGSPISASLDRGSAEPARLPDLADRVAEPELQDRLTPDPGRGTTTPTPNNRGSAEPATSRDLAGGATAPDRLADAIRAPVSRFDRANAMVVMAQEILRGSSVQRSPIDLIVTVQAESLRAGDRLRGDRSSASAAAARAAAARAAAVRSTRSTTTRPMATRPSPTRSTTARSMSVRSMSACSAMASASPRPRRAGSHAIAASPRSSRTRTAPHSRSAANAALSRVP